MEHVKEHATEEKSSNALGMLLFALFLALLAALLWNSCGIAANVKAEGHGHGENAHEEKATGHTTEGHEETTASLSGKVDTLTGDYIYDIGKLLTIDLPNGQKLNAGEYSTEGKLVKFLSDKSAALDTVKGNWFEFTNVRFKTGGAQIDSASLEQIKNMVAIAKSFPSAQFKIGGYTDNTGDSARNVALSQKRAEAVLAELVKQGAAAASFSSAKGYGPQWPVGDNSTAEGRAMNRRVAVNVKAK
ncbi:MAG: OmpA family protein [Ferruginibacter sp.]